MGKLTLCIVYCFCIKTCNLLLTLYIPSFRAKPVLSYAVLVAISQFNDDDQSSRFFGIPEMVEMGVKFRLILNEMWVVPRQEAAVVARALHELRWSGWDEDFTSFLDDHCVYKVHSMLPHSLGQGALLEGLVVQACRTTSEAVSSLQTLSGSLLEFRDDLVAGLKEFSTSPPVREKSFSPPDASGSVSDTVNLLNELSSCEVNAGSPLQQLFQYLSSAISPTKLRFFNFKRIQRGQNVSYIIHVHQDQIFFDYQKNKPASAAQLYRGMEVYTMRERPSGSTVPAYESTQSSYSWDILGISKWKNWNYLKRTFCMRNPLKGLFLDGHDAYMLQVRRQFINWGLPDVYIPDNTAMLTAWGRWMLQDGEAKDDFLTNKKSFSYLSYVDRFLVDYESGEISFEDTPAISTALFIFDFDNITYSKLLAPVLKGYTPSIPEKKAKKIKGAKYLPGNVYTCDHGRLPTPSECPSPYFTIVVPPPENCIDRKTLGMYEWFHDNVLLEPQQYPVVLFSNPTEDISIVEGQLRAFNEEHKLKPKYLLCMPGMQPGSGKSTLAQCLRESCSERNISATVVSSDFFGMKHISCTDVGSRKNTVAKEEFEDAVVDALRCPDTNVVIYDKNIPNMPGFNCLKSVAARAGILNLVIVPIVPDSCTQTQAEACVARVLQREAGSHTLTSDNVIDGYDTVEDFVQDIFVKPCLDFIPIATLLPAAVILENYFSIDSIRDLQVIADRVIDEVCGCSGRKQEPNGELDVTAGTYLGLKFDLDSVTIATFQRLLGIGVRENVHVTINHHGQDGTLMAKTARILKSIDIPNNGKVASVCVTRLARVIASDDGCSGDEGGARRVLAWGSCVVEGYEDLPLHITLAAEGFKNCDARDGELAYAERVVNIEGVLYPIEHFALEPITFEATWSID